MSRQPRLSIRSESGLITVSAVIGIAVACFVAYLLLAAFKGDPAYYGSVPIPSNRAPIELDGGEIDISYAEQTDAEEVAPPEGLSYVVFDDEGQSVEVSSRSESAKDSDAGLARVIGSIDVPENGTYFVTAESAPIPDRVQPVLAFGLSPVGAIRERFDAVVDELKGPAGIVVLVILGLLFLIPRIENAINKGRREKKDIYY